MRERFNSMMFRLIFLASSLFFVDKVICSFSLINRKEQMKDRIAKMKRQDLLRALGACNAHCKNPSLTPDDLELNTFAKSLLTQKVNSVFV